tara:strand:- start:358 stop:570 length:213 start_codon:yes stop_codon:yes gene_type:complete
VAVVVVLTPMDMDLVDLVVVDEVVTLTLDQILVQMDPLTLVVEGVEMVLHNKVLVVAIEVLVDLGGLVKL